MNKAKNETIHPNPFHIVYTRVSFYKSRRTIAGHIRVALGPIGRPRTVLHIVYLFNANRMEIKQKKQNVDQHRRRLHFCLVVDVVSARNHPTWNAHSPFASKRERNHVTYAKRIKLNKMRMYTAGWQVHRMDLGDCRKKKWEGETSTPCNPYRKQQPNNK